MSSVDMPSQCRAASRNAKGGDKRLADGADGGRYYDVHGIENMRHALTILAYEMNGAPVSVLHGAPLRLRCESELGFKMVKWIAAIEFVADLADLGAGQGGYNEDHEFYGYRMPI
jgi:methionine sulfoxide reductase catalytic subunit